MIAENSDKIDDGIECVCESNQIQNIRQRSMQARRGINYSRQDSKAFHEMHTEEKQLYIEPTQVVITKTCAEHDVTIVLVQPHLQGMHWYHNTGI